MATDGNFTASSFAVHAITIARGTGNSIVVAFGIIPRPMLLGRLDITGLTQCSCLAWINLTESDEFGYELFQHYPKPSFASFGLDWHLTKITETVIDWGSDSNDAGINAASTVESKDLESYLLTC